MLFWHPKFAPAASAAATSAGPTRARARVIRLCRIRPTHSTNGTRCKNRPADPGGRSSCRDDNPAARGRRSGNPAGGPADADMDPLAGYP